MSRSPHVFAFALLAALGALVSAGCAGPLALVGSAMGLDMLPAEYNDLAGKRVAVIVVASSSSTGGSIDAVRLAEQLEDQLRRHVPNIKLVGQAEIEDWKDTNDWSQVDYRQIGRGVKAERVVAVDLKSYSLHGSQAVYQGNCELELTVYDMTKGGEMVHRKSPPIFRFPKVAIYTTTEKSESDFRRMFVAYLANEVARDFYAYRPDEAFATDLQFMKD